ncbi:phage tail sheath subtilisin-like domain-containing protein [Streptomyces sp. NPDC048420]|uniref:phage tail sheath family protein n=1 Tax=Streptomyces sp. NPDC048420 TaxID=3155755 RepID=UPI00341C3DF3
MVTTSYPGVYIQELDSGVRAITGVSTSITAFVGRARRGPVDSPTSVGDFGEYVRRFGDLWDESPMGHAVAQFFANGGSEALIVRVHRPSPSNTDGDRTAADVPADGGTPLRLVAATPGTWGRQVRAVVPSHPADNTAFHLTLLEVSAANPRQVVHEERFLNLTTAKDDPRYVGGILAAQSRLAAVDTTAPHPADRPRTTQEPIAFTGGDDGRRITPAQVSDPGLQAERKGIYALDGADLFNLLCIPPFAPDVDPDQATWDNAAEYCADRRAMLIVDPPKGWTDPLGVPAALPSLMTRSANAAVYYPRIRVADPLRENRLGTFVPCGAVAGVIARTDATRGVWKAPAGQEATLNGAAELTVRLTDQQHGTLNPEGVNCLRTFPSAGRVVWGARTGKGADQLAHQWAYLPVRRLALYIEESLYRGTQWVVFEPNDEPLWAQIRLNVGAFMKGLFRRGAFQGTTPAQAYFVRCDRTVNPQEEVDRGIVNIVVGFAPVKPAEFVVISIQQIRPGA